MISPPSNETLNLLQVLMLLVIVGLFVRIESALRKAARLARDTDSKSSQAATRAGLAATSAAKALAEIKGLAKGGRETAANVAADLQSQHERADAVDSTEHGAAADAAATTPKET